MCWACREPPQKPAAIIVLKTPHSLGSGLMQRRGKTAEKMKNKSIEPGEPTLGLWVSHGRFKAGHSRLKSFKKCNLGNEYFDVRKLFGFL